MLLQAQRAGSALSSSRPSRASTSKPLFRTQGMLSGARQLCRSVLRLAEPGAQFARRGLAVRAAAAQVEEQQYEEDGADEPYFLETTKFTPEFENRLFVTGFTGRDMEVKQTKFGPIGTFSLAVRGIKDTTDWFNVELLNAEMIEAYKDVVRKGTYTHVQGRLRVDYWGENKEKFRHVIEADTVVVAAPAEKQAPAASKKASPAPPPPAAPAAAPRAQQQPQARQAQHSQQPAAAAPPAPAPAPAAQKQQQPYGQQKQQAAGSGYSKANSAGAAAAPAAPAKDADLTQLSPADKWAHLGAYPDQWWDNREKKASEKSPDFKAKGQQYAGKVALWLTGKDTPQWAKEKYQSQ